MEKFTSSFMRDYNNGEYSLEDFTVQFGIIGQERHHVSDLYIESAEYQCEELIREEIKLISIYLGWFIIDQLAIK